MSSQSEEMERTESGEYQTAGALSGGGQKNAWQMQKHVIQRKFMEVCSKTRITYIRQSSSGQDEPLPLFFLFIKSLVALVNKVIRAYGVER